MKSPIGIMLLTHKKIQGECESSLKLHTHTNSHLLLWCWRFNKKTWTLTPREAGKPRNEVLIWGPKPRDKLGLKLTTSLFDVNPFIYLPCFKCPSNHINKNYYFYQKLFVWQKVYQMQHDKILRECLQPKETQVTV
jgi:hypothetical protein